ncbi:hypothetical protein ACFWB1_29615 [Streptomyces goshikiensis]
MNSALASRGREERVSDGIAVAFDTVADLGDRIHAGYPPLTLGIAPATA